MISEDLKNKALPVINKIAKSRKAKNAFSYFTPDDIFQEIWHMCLEALSKYDESIGDLENFLNRHVSNRIKNLKRDKYSKATHNTSANLIQSRINLMNALPIHDIDTNNIVKLMSSSCSDYDPLENLSAEELKIYIAENLPADMVADFESVISGNKISNRSISMLRNAVLEILSRLNNGQ